MSTVAKSRPCSASTISCPVGVGLTSHGPIGADVAQDVRELQGLAEIDGVLPGARIRIAEDLDAAEADRRRNAVAVRIELLRRFERGAVDVHLDAVDDRFQRFTRDPVRAHPRRELAGDRMHRLLPGLVAARDVASPHRQPGVLRGRIRDAVYPEVGDVVDGAAEGVDGVERFATETRQREERVVEVRATAASEPRSEVRDAHAADTRLIAPSLT